MVHTESFFAFAKYNGDDAYAQPGNEARTNAALALTRAEYEVRTAANTSDATSGGWVVRADPVDNTQNALVHSSGITTPANAGVTAALRKTMPLHDKQLILGFSLYIPADFVPNASSSTVPCFRMAATTKADTNWTTIAITPITAAKELFRVCNDLSLRWGTDAAMSSKKLRAGVMNYLEVRIAATEVSAWIDDVLVMQKQVGVIPETVAWIFENNINAGGTNMSGLPGRWAISNLYVLANDGLGNTVRLGPTTKVYGARPTADVDVDFIRPNGYTSNAQVAAQDLTDAPAAQLSSVNVGDFDLYETTGAEAVRQVAMIHGVAVKTLATNLEADPHTVRSIATGDHHATQGAGIKGKELVLLSPIPSNRTIRSMAVRPADGCIWAVGDGGSIWKSGSNGNYNSWSRVADSGDASVFYGVAFRSDNVGVAVMVPPSGSSRAYMIRVGNDVVTVPGATGTDYKTFPSASVVPADVIASYDNSNFLVSSSYSGTANTTYFSRSADPINGSWTFNSMVISSTVGGAGKFSKTASRAVAMLTNIAGNVAKTDNSGGSYEALNHADSSSAYQAITYDGTALLIAYSSNDAALGAGPRIRRSTDNGATWSATTPIGSSVAGSNQILRAGASNTAIGESLFCGDAGAIVASIDGLNWRQMPRLTTANLYAAVALPNGDILMGGTAGTLVVYRNQSVDKTLVPLSGYQMVFNCIQTNPQTGLPWTPDEAADANFGMKLTS